MTHGRAKVLAASRAGGLACALVIASSALAHGACPPGASPQAWVDGGALCLAVQIAGNAVPGEAPFLVVLLHGDVSSGGPADYLDGFARSLAGPGVIVANVTRPGYTNGAGHTSGGSHFGRRDSYTAGNIAAVAGAIETLKRRYKPRRVVVVGHSGGAAMLAVAIGRHPGLADNAVLVSCPCDIARWRRERGRGAWRNSLSPSDFADRVPAATRVLAINGRDDDNTRPGLAASFVERLATRGIDARAIVIPGRHGFNMLAPSVAAAVRELTRR